LRDLLEPHEQPAAQSRALPRRVDSQAVDVEAAFPPLRDGDADDLAALRRDEHVAALDGRADPRIVVGERNTRSTSARSDGTAFLNIQSISPG